MTQVFGIDQVKDCIEKNSVTDLIKAIEEGFVMYSQNKVDVPPVGHLSFSNPPGDVHIKYGCIENDDFFVVKIASGFYNNAALNLPTGNGLMLLFSQKTGQLLSILLDEGYLTDLRTAIAGLIAAKYLAPQKIKCIGIVGTGIQARLQLEYLKTFTDCRSVIVWGRNENKLQDYASDMKLSGFNITGTTDIDFLAANANLIITATASKEPLLFGHHIRPGTHITAIGADAEGKQELDVSIFGKADIIVADSIQQCIHHGDISYAVKENITEKEKIREIGEVISSSSLQRKNDNEITVADLTGVAIQDIQITKFVFEKLKTSDLSLKEIHNVK